MGIGEVEVETYLGKPADPGAGTDILGKEEVEVATYLGMEPEDVGTLFSGLRFPAGSSCAFSGADTAAGSGLGTVLLGFRLIRGMETVPVPPLAGAASPAEETPPLNGATGSGRVIFATGAVAVLINCGGADAAGAASGSPPVNWGDSGLSLIVFLAAEEAEDVALTVGILFNAEVSVLRSLSVSVTLEVFSLVSIWLICSFLFPRFKIISSQQKYSI